MSAIEEFKKQASSASFHFADDSCKECGLARKAESAALDIYKNNPDIQEEAKEYMKGQLWAMSFFQEVEK